MSLLTIDVIKEILKDYENGFICPEQVITEVVETLKDNERPILFEKLGDMFDDGGCEECCCVC